MYPYPYTRWTWAKRRLGLWLMERGRALLPEEIRKDFENWMRFGMTYCPGNYRPENNYRVHLANHAPGCYPDPKHPGYWYCTKEGHV